MHAFGGFHFTNGLNLVDQHFEVQEYYDSVYFVIFFLISASSEELQILTLLFKALLSPIYVFWMSRCAKIILKATQDGCVYIYLI